MRFYFLLVMISFFACQSLEEKSSKGHIRHDDIKGPLLGTSIKSFEELNQIVDIKYNDAPKKYVRLLQSNSNQNIISVLTQGITEKDLSKVSKGTLTDKVILALKEPQLAIYRKDLNRCYVLSRRMGEYFGDKDISFYDLALEMTKHIQLNPFDSLYKNQKTEKGFVNTFNHVIAQSFVTAIFSESHADLIADIHERANMPELVTGDFSEDQLKDLKTGPVDNYVDIINNEWGQEYGKDLKIKLDINRHTFWSSKLLSKYLNSIQSEFCWVYEISMKPFRSEDEILKKFAKKLNLVLHSSNHYN